MLDPAAADLVDAIGRLCVLRTEDYTLVNTVFKREREALAQHSVNAHNSVASPAVYLRYLIDDVQRREEQRCIDEQRWCDAVRAWAALYCRRASPSSLLTQAATTAAASDAESYNRWEATDTEAAGASASPPLRLPPVVPIIAFWEAQRRSGEKDAAFQHVYAAVVRQSCELRHSDLISTPFAQLQGSALLYSAVPVSYGGEESTKDAVRAAAVLLAARLSQIHALLFAPQDSTTVSTAAAASPSALVRTLHPLEESGSVTEASRVRLAASRHVWVVLFLLWCHAVAMYYGGGGGGGGNGGKDAEADAAAAAAVVEEWLVREVLVEPSFAFLRSQSQQLTTLLTRVRKACA